MISRILKRKQATPGAGRAAYKKAASAAEVEAGLDELGREWMYGFDLGHGVRIESHSEYLTESHQTRLRMIEPELHHTFDGRWDRVTALDFACNEGWWSFQLARLGAQHVTGFDARLFNVKRAEFVRAQLGAENTEFHVDDAVSFDPEQYGTFDLVLCLGLLYHLEDPVGALRRLRAVTKELCVIETEVARPATITVDRGLVDGLVTTEYAFAVAAEPYYRDVPIASVTGISMIPTLAALRHLLEAVGFTNVTQAETVTGGAERHRDGDRVVLFARV